MALVSYVHLSGSRRFVLCWCVAMVYEDCWATHEGAPHSSSRQQDFFFLSCEYVFLVIVFIDLLVSWQWMPDMFTQIMGKTWSNLIAMSTSFPLVQEVDCCFRFEGNLRNRWLIPTTVMTGHGRVDRMEGIWGSSKQLQFPVRLLREWVVVWIECLFFMTFMYM